MSDEDFQDVQNINQNLRARQQVTAMEFASKYKSKREVYNFLTIDVHAYLPPYDNLTIYFLKDLVSGAKKSKSSNTHFFHINNMTLIVMKADKFQHLAVPQYEGLKLDIILDKIKDN